MTANEANELFSKYSNLKFKYLPTQLDKGMKYLDTDVLRLLKLFHLFSLN